MDKKLTLKNPPSQNLKVKIINHYTHKYQIRHIGIRFTIARTFPKGCCEELVTAKVLVFEVHHSSISGIWDRIESLGFAGPSIHHFNKENGKTYRLYKVSVSSQLSSFQISLSVIGLLYPCCIRGVIHEKNIPSKVR